MNRRITGVILAGVHAWGDCVLERVTVRPLLPIGFRPLIWHTLDWFERGGLRQATICANSDTSVLQRAVGDSGPGHLAVDYYEDVMPRGPAGCARDAAMQGNGGADAYIVVDGTILPDLDLEALLKHHFESGAALTIAASKRIPDDPHVALEPAGVYVFSPEAIDQIPGFGYQDIKESLIPALYEQDVKVTTFEVPWGGTVRITGSGSYLSLGLWLIEQRLADDAIPAGYHPVGDSWVHDSCKVDPSARFVGPVWVGPECVVESGTIIVGPSSLGRGCHVGHDAAISSSLLWERCRVGAEAVVDHCVLTDDSLVDPQTGVRKAVCLPRKPYVRGIFNGAPEPGTTFFSLDDDCDDSAPSDTPRQQENAPC